MNIRVVKVVIVVFLFKRNRNNSESDNKLIKCKKCEMNFDNKDRLLGFNRNDLFFLKYFRSFAWIIVTFELTLLACPTPGRPEAVRTGEPTLFISMAVLILASDADANDGNSGHTCNSNVCDD